MRITALETVLPGPDAGLPSLVFVRVHTDEGLVGHGETYYTPGAVSAYVHEFIAPLILGHDALAPERHWDTLYRAAARFGTKGLEMRALSAVDVALWDLLGQAAGLPVWRLLGGPVRDSVPVYNTCGGPRYGRASRPGYGDAAPAGRLDDFEAFIHRPGELAQDLVAEGFPGMKIWPFDRAAQRGGGQHLSPADLAEGLEPFGAIRDAVGDAIEIMAEGHGFWTVPVAVRIARALEDYAPAWIEDFTLAEDRGALAELRRSTSIPVLASEYLMTRHEYRSLAENGGADLVMIDPTWCGGITEARKIASLVDTWSLPVTMHDCTGPFTLLAGVHVAFSSPNVIYQEVVRAFLRVVYPEWVEHTVQLDAGRISPPTEPGIGAALRPEVLTRPDVRRVWSRLQELP